MKKETENKLMITESYQLVSSVRKMSIYTERLIIEIARLVAEQPKEQEKITYYIPADVVMRGHNYTDLFKTLDEMNELKIKYKDFEKKKYVGMSLFTYLKSENGDLEVDINWRAIEFIRDFTHGYRLYDYKTIMQFVSPYSTAMYKLLSGESDVITYSIEEIRMITGTTDKYPLTSEWTRGVIEQARKEIEKKAGFNFTYEIVKEKSKETGRQKATKITFYRHKKKAIDTDKEMQRQYANSMIPKSINEYLKNKLEFETWEIENNAETISNAIARYGTRKVLNTLQNLAEYVAKNRNRIKNPKGYIVRILKEKTEE